MRSTMRRHDASGQPDIAPVSAPTALPVDSAPERLTTEQGASAAIVERDGEQCIEVRDSLQRLLFEYHPQSGKGSLTMPQGDLALHAPQGNIDLVAGRGIRCTSKDTISLTSARAVEIAARRADGSGESALTLERGLARLRGKRLEVAGEQADIAIDEAAYQGRRLALTVDNVRMVMDKVERVAVRVIERAHDVYRYVQNLDLHKSRRARVLVEDSYHVHSERTVIKARKDVKIKGDKIHLG